MKKAVIYARYSSDSQTEQSIDGQLRVCKEFAEKNGYEIVAEYIDRAMTGTNDNRPDFQRMINVRYSWGISGILNQNSVNSEFVKGRPKTSRPSFCLFFVYSCFNFQMNTFTRQNAVWLLFNTIDYK